MESTQQRSHSAIKSITACLLVGGLLTFAGCSGDERAATPSQATQSPKTPQPDSPAAPEEAPAAEPAETSPADLAARGRTVYMANCIACHSQDPAMDGALGPAVSGSSRELIEARVMRAEYPPGYTPKRDSRVMIALPHLGGELDALAAYLQSGS